MFRLGVGLTSTGDTTIFPTSSGASPSAAIVGRGAFSRAVRHARTHMRAVIAGPLLPRAVGVAVAATAPTVHLQFQAQVTLWREYTFGAIRSAMGSDVRVHTSLRQATKPSPTRGAANAAAGVGGVITFVFAIRHAIVTGTTCALARVTVSAGDAATLEIPFTVIDTGPIGDVPGTDQARLAAMIRVQPAGGANSSCAPVATLAGIRTLAVAGVILSGTLAGALGGTQIFTKTVHACTRGQTVCILVAAAAPFRSLVLQAEQPNGGGRTVHTRVSTMLDDLAGHASLNHTVRASRARPAAGVASVRPATDHRAGVAHQIVRAGAVAETGLPFPAHSRQTVTGHKPKYQDT